MATPIRWHELLALLLLDFFGDSPFEVASEIDVALQKQFLDIALVRQTAGEFRERLPDGLGPLAPHTLITFKSFQDTLNEWTLWELGACYVSYRKQVSPSTTDLLPEEDFRLVAVTARFPRNLANDLELEEVQPGVYDCRWGTRVIRVLVLHQLPAAEHNALLLLFSARPEQVTYAVEHYRRRSAQTSTLIDQLLAQYRAEGVTMPKTLEEFRQYYLREHVHELAPEERLKGLPPEERLKGLPPEERLKGLPPEERLKGLPPEERLKGLPAEERLKGLPPEERLKGLPPEELLKRLSSEEIRAYLKRLENGSSPPLERPEP